jgi:hypothetical protein
MRITSVDFTDLRPEEIEWLEVVEVADGGEYRFDDDEVPF